MTNGDSARGPDGRFAEQSFIAIYDALDRETRRLNDMLSLEIKRIDSLRVSDQTAVTAALTAAEKAVAAALTAAKEAVGKAEIAQQRTNEGQNEFRGQLKDQALTFLTRGEYGLAHVNLEDKVASLEKELGNLRSRIDLGPPSLSVLQQRSDEQTGRQAGAIDTRTVVIAVVGILIAIAGLALAVTR